MAINKNAIIRYHALDRCFSNFVRRFYIEDLLDACNDALYDFDNKIEGVKRRQLYDDIRFMESEQGWNIPLDKIKDGRKVYYRYEDRDFSINKQPVREEEALLLQNTIFLLERFKGLPQFEWVEEVSARLNGAFNLKKDAGDMVVFDSNLYLKGMEHFQPIFNFIYYKSVIKVLYRPFGREDDIISVISPYLLKQYNNRWFLFGYNHQYNSISNYPLDRLVSLDEVNETYIVNDSFDQIDYFEDIVGVTNREDIKVVKVVLATNNKEWEYIKTKPLHGSQRMVSESGGCVEFSLDVKINRELENLLFSYLPNIKVLQPTSLVELMMQRARDIFEF